MTEKVFDRRQDQWTVTISGEIDMYNVGLLKKELSEIDRGDVRLECREMTYIDSTGIGTLASELSRLKNAGYHIVIAGLRPHICKIFKLTAMDSIFLLEENDEKQG